MSYISHRKENKSQIEFSVVSDNEEAEEEKQNSKSILETYCVNLNNKAMDNKIDPIIGRETEIERTVQILCRRLKNNPLFVGDPGVGKTALAEGLAKK